MCQHSLESCCWSTHPVDCMPISPYSESPLGGWKLETARPHQSSLVVLVNRVTFILLTYNFLRGQRSDLSILPKHSHTFCTQQGRWRAVWRCARCEFSSLSPPYSYECGHMYHTMAVNVLLELDWHVDKVICRLTIVELHHVNIWSTNGLKKHLVLHPCFELFNFPIAHKWSIHSSWNERVFKNDLHLGWLLQTCKFSYRISIWIWSVFLR